MTLDELLDGQEPERRPDSRGWLVTRILLLTLAATALGGVLLVLALYLAAVGGLTVLLESDLTIG